MKKMSEKDFVKLLQAKLEKGLKECSVVVGESLFYKIIVDENGEFHPSNPKEPKRGNLAFQTDLLIKEGNLPLIVVEAKVGEVQTHDVLTYSTKAVRHKEIYPYLRYGLVVWGRDYIPNKFFTHNVGFDFALAINDEKKLLRFIELINTQIKSAESLLEILKKENKPQMFSTVLEIK